jgi:hypothetical protein
MSEDITQQRFLYRLMSQDTMGQRYLWLAMSEDTTGQRYLWLVMSWDIGSSNPTRSYNRGKVAVRNVFPRWLARRSWEAKRPRCSRRH